MIAAFSRRIRTVWSAALIGFAALFVLVVGLVVPAQEAAATTWGQGTLASARNADGRLELFGLDASDNVWHRRQTTPGSATWTPWEQYGGKMRSIAAETQADGRIELWGVNGAGEFFHRWQIAPNQDVWSAYQQGWTNTPLRSLAMARNADGRLEVFATDIYDQVLYNTQLIPNANAWKGWRLFNGNLRSVAASTQADGRIELWGVNLAGQLFHRWQLGANREVWSTFEQVATPTALTSLTVARDGKGLLGAFGTDGNAKIYQTRQLAPNLNSWSGWTDFSDNGGLDSVVAQTNADGRIEVFGAYPGGYTFQKVQQLTGGWAVWERIPGAPLGSTAPEFRITAADPERVKNFILAIGTPVARVRIAADVNLDLSGLSDLHIAEGVQIIGEQTAAVPKGPRLFTKTIPRQLLIVDGDYVRISGIRMDGGLRNRSDSVGNKLSDAIVIESRRGVSIDHNELFGWGGAAINVSDYEGRLDRSNLVLVSQNDIHHNQFLEGYGVVVGNGAYAYVDRNVFYSNRHAIAGDGAAGSGYLAYRNLIFSPGFGSLDSDNYEHSFDMHGRDNCGDAHANCGLAGEYMDVRYNSFVQNSAVTAIKLRGTPTIGMDVKYNTFIQSQYVAHLQTETGMHPEGNTYRQDHFGEKGRYRCDFDHDGKFDQWTATGRTMWFMSSLRSDSQGVRWEYVMQTTKLAPQITATDLAPYFQNGTCS